MASNEYFALLGTELLRRVRHAGASEGFTAVEDVEAQQNVGEDEDEDYEQGRGYDYWVDEEDDYWVDDDCWVDEEGEEETEKKRQELGPPAWKGELQELGMNQEAFPEEQLHIVHWGHVAKYFAVDCATVALFIGCDWGDQFGKHLLLFIVAAGSFFLYFHATRYADSYLGFILIFFTCKALIKRCDVDAFSYKQFYFDIVDIVAALVIILALDTLCDVLSRRRPSRLACRAYSEGWRYMRESLAQLLDGGSQHAFGVSQLWCPQRLPRIYSEYRSMNAMRTTMMIKNSRKPIPIRR